MSRYAEELRHVVAYARRLKARADARQLNANNIENLLRGYVDAPGFWSDWRLSLVKDALKEVGL